MYNLELFENRFIFNKKYQKIDVHKFSCIYCIEIINKELKVCKVGFSTSIRARLDRIQSDLNTNKKESVIGRILLAKNFDNNAEKIIHEKLSVYRLAVKGHYKLTPTLDFSHLFGYFDGDTEVFSCTLELVEKCIESTLCLNTKY